MIRLSAWAVRRPVLAIVAWLVVVIAIGVGASTAGGSYNDSFQLPDTESARAQQLLADEFGAAQSSGSVQIVFRDANGGPIADVQPQMEALLADVEANPSVSTVASPYGTDTDQQGLVSEDGTVGRATVTFTTPDTDVPLADVKDILSQVEAAESAGVEVGLAGQVVDRAATEAPSSEGIGILVAIVLLLLMFGSLVAAGLPIVTALLGLGAGLGLVTISAGFADIATFAPTLASMIGLGVGIDYSLFVINRYRQAVIAGREPKEAALESVRTAGRAVVFAGTTVIIALLGLFVLGINFMNGLAIASALTVLTVMLTAITLLPALLSLLGARSFGLRMPWTRNREPHPEGVFFAKHGRALARRPFVYLAGALIFVLALAAPVLGIRSGFPDAGGKPVGDVQRIAYDLTSDGFGAGANGPFLVVAELPTANDAADAEALSKALGEAEGVASASPAQISESGTTALIQVQPTTGPQDAATSDLLQRLRTEVVPAATAGTGVTASVGGSTAVISDFGKVLTDALPLFLLVVVGLGFLALVLLFRSLVVPLIGALTSLLSFGAGLGAAVAVFQWGWFDNVLGVTATGPILPFLPVMLFAILFGLSMDYQVFLVSRMQEEWNRSKDNGAAVRRGLGGSGRVVAVAAAIMASVFLSFVFGSDATIKMFGLSLGVAVLVDAFIVRLILVPSLMNVVGNANWWLPAWLSRILPVVQVESDEEAAEIADFEDDFAQRSEDDADEPGDRLVTQG